MLLFISLALSLEVVAADFQKEWQEQKKKFGIDQIIQGAKNKATNQTSREIYDILDVNNDQIKQKQNLINNDLRMLENQAKNQRSQENEDNELLNQLENNTNISVPGVQTLKKFADKVSQNADNLLSHPTEYLKQYGFDINCDSTEGSVDISPEPFVVEFEPEEIRDEVYEPKLCEYLTNTYHCKDALELQCVKHGTQHTQIQIINTNAHHFKKQNSLIITREYHQIMGSNLRQYQNNWFAGKKRVI